MSLPLLLFALAAPADGYRDLFNGTDLAGWVAEGPPGKDGNPVWSVADGKIACSGKAYGFLRYDREQFGDFALRVEYKFDPPAPGAKRGGNSGLGIRTVPYDPKEREKSRPSYAAYEVQLLDDAGKPPDADHGTGSLYRYAAPAANPARPAPEWNVIEVTCVGPKIAVAINGEKVLEADQSALADMPAKERPKWGPPAPKDKPLRGYVCLQSHDGRVEFRKVRVKDLGK